MINTHNAHISPEADPHPRIAWVYGGTLDKLDAATWLEPVKLMRESKWEVTLIAVGDPQKHHIKEVEIVHISRPDIYVIRQIFFHLRVIKFLFQQLNEIDILLFHEASSPWFLIFRFFLRLFGKKNLLFVMDTRTLPMEPEDKATWKDRLRAKFSSQINKYGNRFFDGRLTITKRMAQSLHIPPEKLWGVWPSGVKLETFAIAKQERRFPSIEEPIHLIYIGCMHHERNLVTLSKAVTQANTDKHLFTLTIIGDGNARVELEEYAQTKGKHVHILPPVPHEEIPGWLAKAHIGTLPFPDEEKFRVSSPIKLFEYLAAGMPILATRIDCHTDVIEEIGIAFWAEGSDQQGLYRALMEIEVNRDKLSAMSEKAAALAPKWTWQSSTKKLKQALVNGIEAKKHL